MPRPKWRRPLQLSKSKYDDFFHAQSILRETGELPGIVTDRPDLELENFYAVTRWTQSSQLTVAVTSRAVRVLSDSVFEDMRIDDLYFPEGCDCFQIVSEEGDPILRENLIFVKPDRVYDKYFLMSGTNPDNMAVLSLLGTDRIGDAEDTVDSNVERQVDPSYLAVIAAIGFLADNDEEGLLRHEVLASDVDRYTKAIKEQNDKEIAFLESRAIRRGKNRRLLDTFELDIGEFPLDTNSTSRSAGGHSFRRPHLRRGHFRAIRYGEGRKRIKMKWIPPVVVRKDLLIGDGDSTDVHSQL